MSESEKTGLEKELDMLWKSHADLERRFNQLREINSALMVMIFRLQDKVGLPTLSVEACKQFERLYTLPSVDGN